MKKDKKVYIPLELLEVLPFQNTREDVAIVASQIVRTAAVPPQARFNDLRRYVERLKAL